MIMINIRATWAFCLLFAAVTVSAQANLDEKLSLADKQFELYAYQLAIKSYNEVLKSQPSSTHALSQLGRCYLQVGMPTKAIEYFEKAVALPGFDEAIPLQFGQALMMTGDYSKAKVWFNLYGETNEAVGSHFVQVANWAAQNTSTQSDYEVKPEMLNTPQSDFLPSFYGDKVVYGSTRNDIERKNKTGHNEESWAGGANPQLFVTNLDGKSGFLQRPTLLKGDLQASYNEGPVAYSVDGNKVAFCRNNFLNGNRQLAESGMNLSMYIADVVGGAWMNVRAFSHNGSDFGTGFPAFSADGKTLYFASNRPGTGSGGWDIYTSDWNGKDWTSPANIGTEINTPGNEITPFFDGNTFYFSSDWHAGFGGLDVFSSQVQDGRFTGLKNAGRPINSTSDDYGFIYRSQNSKGYFTSSRAGGVGLEDIYRVSRQGTDYLITVTDANGRAIPQANIDLTACGQSIYSTANDGKYRFTRPSAADACKVRVSHAGYMTTIAELNQQSTNLQVMLTADAPAPVEFSTATTAKPEALKPSKSTTPAPTERTGSLADSFAKAKRETKTAEVPVTKPEAAVAAIETPKPVTHSTPSSTLGSAPSSAPSGAPLHGSKSSVRDIASATPQPAPMVAYTMPETFDGYAVQLIALPENTDESNLTEYNDLGKYGNVYVKSVDGKKRVRVGVYATAAEAQDMAKTIKKSHKTAYVVDEQNIDIALKYKDQPTVAPSAPVAAPAPVMASTKTVAEPSTSKSTSKSTSMAKGIDEEPELIIMRYAVQLGAYKNDGDAIDMSMFMPVSSIGHIYTLPEKEITRVRLGVWEDPAKAEAAKKEAIAKGFKEAMVVNEKSTRMTQKFLVADAPAPVQHSTQPSMGSAPTKTVAAPTAITNTKAADSKTAAATKTSVKKGITEAPVGPAPFKAPAPVVPAAPSTRYLVRVAAHTDVNTFDEMYIAGIPAEKEIKKSGKYKVIYLSGFDGLESAIEAKNTVVKRGMKDAYVVKEVGNVMVRVKI
jgi:WD40-like Beta Propeller Repeat/Tetratricopeptide repeat